MNSKWIKKWVIGIFLPFLFGLLEAQDSQLSDRSNALEIQSGEAHYDGKKIWLTGNVEVKHPLGYMTAHQFLIESEEKDDKKSRFSLLKMSDDVHIKLQDGGDLTCQQAEIDYNQLQGKFWGSSTYPDITYSLVLKNEKNEKKDVTLDTKSHFLTLHLQNQTSHSLEKKQIKSIQFLEKVRAHYSHSYFLVADQAEYHYVPDSQAKLIAGLLTLQGFTPSSRCQLTTANGDSLESQYVKVDTAQHQLELDQVEGRLCLYPQENIIQYLNLSAQHLIWKDLDKELLLSGLVKVSHTNGLQFVTDQQVKIGLETLNGKQSLRFIDIPHSVEVNFLDALNHIDYHVYCPGFFNMDNQKQIITLVGIKNSEGIIEDKHQIHLKNKMGEMHADRAFIEYEWDKGNMIPTKMSLEGQVRVMSQDNPLEKDQSTRYALAHQLEYFPKEEEMFLIGQVDQPVLFFDQTNHIQVSAHKLKIYQDVITKKEAIQGIGDVRFIFINKELAQLNKRFGLENSSQKEKDT